MTFGWLAPTCRVAPSSGTCRCGDRSNGAVSIPIGSPRSDLDPLVQEMLRTLGPSLWEGREGADGRAPAPRSPAVRGPWARSDTGSVRSKVDQTTSLEPRVADVDERLGDWAWLGARFDGRELTRSLLRDLAVAQGDAFLTGGAVPAFRPYSGPFDELGGEWLDSQAWLAVGDLEGELRVLLLRDRPCGAGPCCYAGYSVDASVTLRRGVVRLWEVRLDETWADTVLTDHVPGLWVCGARRAGTARVDLQGRFLTSGPDVWEFAFDGSFALEVGGVVVSGPVFEQRVYATSECVALSAGFAHAWRILFPELAALLDPGQRTEDGSTTGPGWLMRVCASAMAGLVGEDWMAACLDSRPGP